MSKILLINSNRYKQPWPVIPYGVCCVAAACEAAGHEARVLDLCFSTDCRDEVHRTVADFQPDVVGIGVRNIDDCSGARATFLLDEVRDQVVHPVKEALSGPIVIGGAAVGINAGELLDFFDLDYAVRGDGELVMVELVKRLASGANCEGLDGLVTRNDGRILGEDRPCRAADLDHLPVVLHHKYVDVAAYRKFNSPLQVQTKRGCALECAYCVYNQVEGRRYRLRRPQILADEIQRLVKETGIRHVEFVDSTFNIPLEHAKAVLRALIAKRLNLQLCALGLNPGAVDEELVKLMKEAGFSDVNLGAESGSDVTLRSLGKNFSRADLLRAGKLLREKDIPAAWFLLFGAPGETPDTVKETIRTVTRAAGDHNLVCAVVGIRAYKGSPIARQMQQQDATVAADGFLHPVSYQPADISLDEIQRLVKRAWFDHPNLLIAPDDEDIPVAKQKAGVRLLRLLGSDKPLWSLYIFNRRLAKRLGIMRIKRWLWERKQKSLTPDLE